MTCLLSNLNRFEEKGVSKNFGKNSLLFPTVLNNNNAFQLISNG